MRIALATVGTAGDVRPFAVLARGLVARGHEVTAVTWPVHRTVLAIPGVRVEVAGPHADPARIATVAAEAAGHRPMQQLAILRDFHLADGEAHYRQLREILPGHDLVLLNGIHTLAQAAALDAGLRWTTVVFDPLLLRTGSAPPFGMPNLGPANRLLWRHLDRRLAGASRPLADLLARAGSPRRRLRLFRAHSPDLHLVACSPSIVPIPPDLPRTTSVTGAWLDLMAPDALPEPVEDFLSDGAPPIVISFGSMAGLVRGDLDHALRTMLEGGRRVILQATSSIASPSLLQAGHLDHRALFPRACVVVHHGGAGTTHAACSAGVPSVIVPHLGDQRYWADRLHRLGVAPLAIESDATADGQLADAALATATDHRMHERARELATRMAEEDGVAESVALLERLARKR